MRLDHKGVMLLCLLQGRKQTLGKFNELAFHDEALQ